MPVGRVFFFNGQATTEIYTHSLHDALPIFRLHIPLRFALAVVFGVFAEVSLGAGQRNLLGDDGHLVFLHPSNFLAELLVAFPGNRMPFHFVVLLRSPTRKLSRFIRDAAIMRDLAAMGMRAACWARLYTLRRNKL